MTMRNPGHCSQSRTYPPLAHRAATVRGTWLRGQGADKSGCGYNGTLRKLRWACPLDFGAKTKPLNWRGLALALAKEHVLGFSVRKSSAESPRRGAPQKWTHELEVQLLGEVAKLRFLGKNVDEACKKLIRKEPWHSLVGVSRQKVESVAKWETLKRRYNMAKKKYEGLTPLQTIDRMVRLSIYGQ